MEGMMVTIATGPVGRDVEVEWQVLGSQLNYYPGTYTFSSRTTGGFVGSQLLFTYQLIGSGLTYDSQGNPEPGGSLFSLHSLGNNLMVSGFALTVAQWNAMGGPSFAVQFLAGNDVFRG